MEKKLNHMTNTKVRVIAGLSMASILLTSLYLGTMVFSLLAFVIWFLLADELLVNFFKTPRKSGAYILNQTLSFSIYGTFQLLYWNHIVTPDLIFTWVVPVGIFATFFSLGYLFFIHDHNVPPTRRGEKVFSNQSMKELWTAYPMTFVLSLVFQYLCLALLIFQVNGNLHILEIILIASMMDTGAYFSGKLFGKTKLWEKVSPKKTVEGLIGGILFSSLVVTFYHYKIFAQFSFFNCLVFAALAGLSQVGDLFQSKVKRLFSLKDSSSLIPGHGGVYDRLDSLLIIAPWYLLWTVYIS